MKRLVILGAGESGLGAALLGKDKAWKVFVSDAGKISASHKAVLDAEGIEWEEQGHTLSKILSADLVIKSPGIPDTVEVILTLKKANKQIQSEIEFAGSYTKKPIVAITGSNGKTTTTSLLAHILEKDGVKVGLCGNIGTSFALLVRDDSYECYVVELSSFQLEGIENFRPDIAVLTNLSKDHLDRYAYDYDKYIAAKFRISLNQTVEDYFLYDAEDKEINRWLNKLEIRAKQVPFSVKNILKNGTCMEKDNLKVHLGNKVFTIPTAEINLQGEHNLKNAMAAATAAKLLNIRKKTIRESLQSFQGVSHRLEKLLPVNKVHYINDSKATNVNAAYYALDSVSGPIVWIVGGVDKGNNYEDLLALVKNKVKAIVALGINNAKLRQMFLKEVPEFTEVQSMYEAVQKATAYARQGETILLSPACASFDLFKDYEDRGNQFKKEVEELRNNQ